MWIISLKKSMCYTQNVLLVATKKINKQNYCIPLHNVTCINKYDNVKYNIFNITCLIRVFRVKDNNKFTCTLLKLCYNSLFLWFLVCCCSRWNDEAMSWRCCITFCFTVFLFLLLVMLDYYVITITRRVCMWYLTGLYHYIWYHIHTLVQERKFCLEIMFSV